MKTQSSNIKIYVSSKFILKASAHSFKRYVAAI